MHRNKIFYFLLAGIAVGILAYTGRVQGFDLETYGLREGNLISAVGSDDPDIYIVNEYGYKRLFINPAIFGFYGHLGGFENVKNIPPATRDIFPTSGLFRNCESNDPKIYALEVIGEDLGYLHWLNVSGAQAVFDDPNFFKKVFCINTNEFSWYLSGSDYTSITQTPTYSRTGLKVDLKVNGSDAPAPVSWNSTFIASWTSSEAVRCAGLEYLAPADAINPENLSLAGSATAYARATIQVPQTDIAVHIICYDSQGQYTEDFISLPIIPASLPSLTIVSPATTAVVAQGNSQEIRWESRNLSSRLNIVLQKPISGNIHGGEYWYIAKNIPNTGAYLWNTGDVLSGDATKETLSRQPGVGSYYVFISNDEESVFFGGDKEITIVAP